MSFSDQVSILLVDDRRDKLMALETVLSDLGQRIVKATSGGEALRALLKEDFAVVILDVNMPGMDGFETASLIRQRKRSEHTPIIFVTGINVTETHVTRGYQLGAVDYIFAPFEPAVLRSKVSVFIDLFRKTLRVKQQEAALRLAAEERAASIENRLSDLLTRLNVGIFRATADGICTEYNPALERILSDFKQDAYLSLSALQLSEAGEVEGDRCIRLTRRDGSPRWLSISTRRAEVNGEAMIEGLVEDVTDRKEFEEALKRSEARHRTLIEALPQLVWTSRPNGEWDFVSPQWNAFTGRTPKGLMGDHWTELIHPDDRDAAIRQWHEAVRTKSVFDVEIRFLGHDEIYRWFKTRAVPLVEDDGSVQKWFGTCTDIDDRKQTEAALKESARMKDEFLAMLSHELRNPLNAISSAVMISRRRSDAESLNWSQDVIERQVKQLVRLIDDLLDVSRITRGKIQLKRETLDVRDVIHSALSACRPLIDERRHRIITNISDEKLYVHGDPARLQQILVNLVTNSAKYTEEEGAISLLVSRDADDIVITVKDSGMGIAPDVLPRIFDLFSQADRSLARSKGGLGIGLTVAKKLVELHNGTLTASSNGIGEGSEFTIRMPGVDADPNNLAASAPQIEVPQNLKILLVDDHQDTLEGISFLLGQHGCVIQSCSDGRTAVAAAKEFLPDLILLDIGLPELNGYEVAKTLRADPLFQETVIVAVSGYGQEQDRATSRASGFNFHLVKPLDLDLLFSTVLPLLRQNHLANGAAKRPAVGSEPRTTVLN